MWHIKLRSRFVWCFFIWKVLLHLAQKVFGHWEHLYMKSSNLGCTSSLCLFTACNVKNIFEQISHMTSLTPVCFFMCVSKMLLYGKPIWQISHVNPLRCLHLICDFKELLLVNILSHSEHGCGFASDGFLFFFFESNNGFVWFFIWHLKPIIVLDTDKHKMHL